jgi:SAM-dependent methyltransferase
MSSEELLSEAEGRPVNGWDFSWLGPRIITSALPWDYESMVLGRARRSPDLLDLETGGGEWLATLPYRPPRTVATETWEPNVEVAAARLTPLGVAVVPSEAAPDNVDQRPGERYGRLPFPPDSFALVTNRHGSFLATEIARVLIPGGSFLTQQVGGDYGDFYDALELPHPERRGRRWDLGLALQQVEAAGLRVAGSGEATLATSFADVGAFAWYLKAIPWTVAGFSIERYRRRLERLHDRIAAEGPLTTEMPAFWLEAIRP